MGLVAQQSITVTTHMLQERGLSRKEAIAFTPRQFPSLQHFILALDNERKVRFEQRRQRVISQGIKRRMARPVA